MIHCLLPKRARVCFWIQGAYERFNRGEVGAFIESRDPIICTPLAFVVFKLKRGDKDGLTEIFLTLHNLKFFDGRGRVKPSGKVSVARRARFHLFKSAPR